MKTKPIAIFGEVLFDHFPDGKKILGGAPFNVAWHLQAFGLQPDFISRVGNDVQARQIELMMQSWGLTTANLQVDSKYPTGHVAVSLDNNEPSYAILDDQAYDFIAVEDLRVSDAYAIVYHGSLALRHDLSKQTLSHLLKNHRGKVFVDVNLRAPWWHAEQLDEWLHHADWLKLNSDELRQLSPEAEDITAAMRRMLTHYKLELMVVTLGSEGALALTESGELVSVHPPTPPLLIDTVGAGDAFSAVLLLGLYSGWSLSLTLERAQTFASALLGQPGATVQNIAFYRSFSDSWQLPLTDN